MTLVRAAVALNNMGVALLEHGDFAGSLTTLKDSVAILKLAFPSSDTGILCRTREDEIATEKLHRAAQRFVQPCHKGYRQIPAVSVHVLNEEQHDYCDHDPSMYSSTKTVYPVRIETYDVEGDGASGLETAIAIYNCAVAHICLASITPRAAAATQRTTLSSVFSTALAWRVY